MVPTPILLSVADVALLLNDPERTIRHRCKELEYRAETEISPANGGKQYRIHLSSLPQEAQAKYWIGVYHDTFLPTSTREQKWSWLESLQLEFDVHMPVYRAMGLHIEPEAWTVEESEKRHDELFHKKTWAKETVRERAHLLRGVIAAKRRAPEKLKTQAGKDYAALVNKSYATLAAWHKQVKHLQQKDWEPALVPGWKGGRKKVDIHPAVWEHITSRYLVESQPTAKSVYQYACRWAEQKGFDVPSYRIVLARLKGIDRRVHVLKREGETAFNNLFPGIVRDWSSIELFEVLNADGRKGDTFCIWPDGHIGRPVYVAWLDLCSRMYLGAAFDKGENVDLVRKSYRAAVERAGCVPTNAYLDNGAAFASKEFTGGQTKRNRFKVNQSEISGILTLTGVKVTWATPGHGQAKPIESWWNTIARAVDQRAEFVKAYCGKDTVSRPEGSNPKAHPIPIADYIAAFEEEAQAYNLRAHRGVGMNGKSPMQVYTELKDKTILLTPTKEQMAWCMLVAQPVMLSKRDGSFTINGNVYWHEELPKLKGTGPYTARYDGDDSKVPVHILDGETFICSAELRLAIGARGQVMATSLYLSRMWGADAVPVLSPARQSAGRPARIRCLPVVVATIQAANVSRAVADNHSLVSRWAVVRAIAVGVVVSRMSWPVTWLSAGSKRSSRVVVSPVVRRMAVKPAGPPISFSSRLAAGLSLVVCVASASAATAMPPRSRCCVVTGACDTMSALP